MKMIVMLVILLSAMVNAEPQTDEQSIIKNYEYTPAVSEAVSKPALVVEPQAMGPGLEKPEDSRKNQRYDANDSNLNYHQWKMLLERNRLIYCIVLSVTALVSLIITLWFLTKTRYSAEHIVNASGLILIVFGTIILVILATAEAQLTAAIGILGAIAGYLFGSLRKEKPTVTDD